MISEKDHPCSSSFKPLSIKRPHPNCSIENDNVYAPFTSHLTSGEWRILAWLEREGLNYDLVSGYEFDKYNFKPENYPAIILNTHNEYWTDGMYGKLKEFKKEGGSILNLSGNSIYRQVKFTKQYNLKCVSLKFNKTVEDETKLIGVRFDMRGYGSCAPYKVTKPGHWIFNGTGLKKDDLFGNASLNSNTKSIQTSFEVDPASKPGMAKLKGTGASGWETDKISSTAPDDVTLLAKGTNRANGGAEMIIRELKNGSIIFSASSITFGGSLLVDQNCSQLVKNVLAKIQKKKEFIYSKNKKVSA